MEINKIEIIEFEAFEKVINIKLFNDVISFIIETANLGSMSNKLNYLREKHIWFEKIQNNNIQTEYGFRYLGELLER